MKKIISCLVLLTCFVLLSAQTNIPGGILVDLDWTAGESPYIIDGEIDLSIGDELVIDPGVTVQFSGHYKFNVFGRIVALGTALNPIEFTALNTVTGWHGLRFFNTSSNGQTPSQLTYCNFEYGMATGTGDDYRGGAIFCSNADQILITYSNFTNNTATTGGAMYLANSDIIIEDTIIDDNFVTGAGGGIYLNVSDVTMQTVEITNNISQYDGGGLNCYDSDPVLTDVLIAANFTEWNGGGISAFNNSNPNLTNVTIADNIANQSGSGLACLYNSNVTMINSIVWGDETNIIYLEPTASFAVTYSDLESGTGQSYFGTGCIDADPLFTNPFFGDYTLSWLNIPTPDETKSPCIDSGDPNSTFDPDGTVSDMGAFYFPQNGITGTVTLDGGTGNVVETVITATLTTPPSTVYTTNPDVNGNYVLNLLAGTYDLFAVLDGYSPFPYDNIVVENELVVIDIILTPPPPGEIIGHVDVEGIGNPEDVVVSAGTVSTNPVGIEDPLNPGTMLYYEYILEITPGSYDVTAELPGYETQIVSNVIVESGLQTTGVDFYLPLVLNEGTIAGTVTLVGGGGNVEDVVITAGNVSVSPEADGSYELEILNGTYDVIASLNGYSSPTQSDIQVVAFQTLSPVDFHLVAGWEPITGTQFVMTAYCTVTYDGAFMSKSSNNQLAAFGFDQATGLIEECRGLATWEPGNHNFWGNYWSIEGYWYITIVSDNDSGLDNIWFDFYDSETGIIYDCNEQIFFQDCTIYPTGVNLTIDSPSNDFTFDLIDGWNWISFNLEPTSYLIDGLFDVLETTPDIYQVKSQTDFGQFDPILIDWIGGLNFLSYDEGYKIYMLNAYNDFVFSGEKINPLTHSVQLEQNYNWISFIPQNSLDLEDALESIGVVEDTYIKNQTQSAVFYGGWIGDLQIMEPGVSYILFWPDEVTPDDPLFLDYPANVEEPRENLIVEETFNPANWVLMPGTQTNMILMADACLNERVIDNNTHVIGLFDKNGLCHSIGKFDHDLWYFTVLGESDDELYFKLFDISTGETKISEGSITYQANSVIGNPRETFSIRFQGENNTPQNPETFLVSQNYPNPFNPSTSISYDLPEEGLVQLEIFNVKGQLVKTLVNQLQPAGNYQVNWDASDQSSGIYFYKVRWDGNQEIRKCILMK
ncbi:T9SS type A sorting domain-containing protein [Candidatus Cloacimonadota bacterium]